MASERERSRAWVWWVCVAAYVALIFVLSSRPRLRAPVTFPLWDKVAHLGEYGLLGFLGQRAAGATWSRNGPAAHWRGLSVVACGLLIALADEALQAHTPGREASVADFLADGLGLILSWVGDLLLRRPGRGSGGGMA